MGVRMKKMDASEILREIRASGWDLPLELIVGLSEYEKGFVLLELSGNYGSMDWYLAQCHRLGLVGHNKVLDAGAGMGQWAIAAARLNSQVLAQDINLGRLELARALKQKLEVQNLEVGCAPAENSGVASSSIDAVICHGTFMFTDMEKTLKEFHRVLRPGGMVYLTANTIGWYLHLIFDRIIRGREYSLWPSVNQIIRRTLRRRSSNVIVSKSGLRRRLVRAGFEVGKIYSLGEIGQDSWNFESPPGRHPATFYGLPSVAEAIAIKK